MYFVKVNKRDKDGNPIKKHNEILKGKPSIEDIKKFNPSYGFIGDNEFKTTKESKMNKNIEVFANLINMKAKDSEGDLQRSNNDDAYFLTYNSRSVEDYLEVLES